MTKNIVPRSKRLKDTLPTDKQTSGASVTTASKPPPCETILTTGTWEDYLSEAPIFDYSNNSVTLKFKVDGKINGQPYLVRVDKKIITSGWMGLNCSLTIIPEVVGNLKKCIDDNGKHYYNDKDEKIGVVYLSEQIKQPPSTSLPEIEQKQQRLTFTFTPKDKLSIPSRLLVLFTLEYRSGGTYSFYYP